MGLSPAEVWAYTPWELSQAVRTHQQQEEVQWHRTAWQVCYLLSPWSNKALTPHELLYPKQQSTSPLETETLFQARWEEHQQRQCVVPSV